MNWKRLTAPADNVINLGAYYVFGIWDEQLQEVKPLHMFKVIGIAEDYVVCDNNTCVSRIDIIQDVKYYVAHISRLL